MNKKRMYQGCPPSSSSRRRRPPAAAAPRLAAAPSATTELERLAKLRNDGVLTEDEFQAQKAKILGQG